MKLCSFFILIGCLLTQQAKAQNEINKTAFPDGAQQIVKLNITAIALRNVSLQYERSVAKHISVAMGLRVQPKGALPLKNVLLNQLDETAITAQDFVSNTKISSWGITPEVRYYFGKRPMNGVYIAAWGRVGQYGINWNYYFVDDQQVGKWYQLDGKLKTLSYGLLLGAQCRLHEKVRMDFWILGPHIVNVKGQLDANGDFSDLDQYERARLKTMLEGFAVDDNRMTTTISDHNINGKFNANIYGLRAGISIGVAF